MKICVKIQLSMSDKWYECLEGDGSDASYFVWLSTMESPIKFPRQLKRLDKKLYHLLKHLILQKNPHHRASITEVMRHDFLRPASTF